MFILLDQSYFTVYWSHINQRKLHLKSCGTDNVCTHSVPCKWPNSLQKLIFFSMFHPNLLQILSYQASHHLNFCHFPFSMHKSVICMDSNNDGFVHQCDIHFMNAFMIKTSVSNILCTNVLLLNQWFSILPLEVLLSILMVAQLLELPSASIHQCPFVCVGDPWWPWLARALLIQNLVFISFFLLTLVALQAMNDRFAFLNKNVIYLSNRETALV